MKTSNIRLLALGVVLLLALLLLGWQRGLFDTLLGQDDKSTIPPILLAIRKVDQIPDPYQRCMRYPQPRGIDWPRSLIAAFCADELTPIPDYSDLRELINEGKAEEIDRLFDGIVTAYFDGRFAERAMWLAYEDNFLSSNIENDNLTERWVELAPNSGHANVARGLYFLQSASDARGGKVISKTPEKYLERMDHFLDLAIVKLNKGLEINPKIMPAYGALIDVARFGGDDRLGERAFVNALQVDPDSYYVRARMQWKAQRRWGGSYARQLEIARRAEPFLGSNPRLATLHTLAIWSQVRDVYSYQESPSEQVALDSLERALLHSPTYLTLSFAADSAEELGDCLRSIELYTQMMRFNPSSTYALRERANCIAELGLNQWAMSEYQKVLSKNPNDQEALKQYAFHLIRQGKSNRAATHLARLAAIRPTDDWVLQELARIYLYELRRFERAEPVIDQLLKLEPESGKAWLFRVDLLHDTDSPGLEEAMRQFIKYADESNKVQRQALVKIKAWLADHAVAEESS